ncbi:E3 ubiquitin-protein ligase RNF19B [Amia ocellicauda]|uniref:E3 ubiquitin-protein ligase RNF19B n=1 Tax=Amia ocellicauda TaxID=2972642 RepID=UPI0034647832
MGSEKDSASPQTSISGVPQPNPKRRSAGKRSRISFQSLFHSKRASRGKSTAPASAQPTQALQQQQKPQQQQQPPPNSQEQCHQLLHPPPLLPQSPATPQPPCSNLPSGTTAGYGSEGVLSGSHSSLDSGAAAMVAVGSSSPSPTTAQPQDHPPLPSGSPLPCTLPLLECPLCLVQQPPEQVPEILGCSHRSCLPCLRQYLRIEIRESRVQLSCPECAERLSPQQVGQILDEDAALLAKYEEFLLRRCLAADPDCRWCPAPDCGYAVIAHGCASCPKLSCQREGCGAEFCYHCKQAWHPNQTCDSARQERALHLPGHSAHSPGPSYGQEQGTADDIKPCPRCGAYIIKMNDGSCNHMTCAVCGCEFCWLCMKEISDLHYLSPSGCTFWGKKPWSRKKKIVWQLGTLIGAPVGISLIAGIALPAMLIGIPVYVGRKIHSHYDSKKVSRPRRNLAITGGVALSILTAPVIAAVSVGIGVPIMLAYVYGVVPVSLCRGGGCGVSRAKGRGVKIDFDEDDGPITVADAWRALKRPSLGESSLEGVTSALSTTSPSEGVAGAGLGDTPRFNTLAGGALGTGGGKYSRLQVQVSGVLQEAPRDSGSVGGGSDCASTRAMAGSLSSAYCPHDRESTNLEIQVDIETKPSHLRLSSEGSEDDLLPASHLAPPPPSVTTAPGPGEEPQDCSSRRGGLGGGGASLSSGETPRRQCGDVTLAQPESLRSELESSDTQSDDLADLSFDDGGSPHSPRPTGHATLDSATPTCQPSATPTHHHLHCPDKIALYV